MYFIYINKEFFYVFLRSKVLHPLPLSCDINFATFVDHSKLMILKNALTSLSQRWLNIFQIFSNSTFPFLTVAGILFHKNLAFDLMKRYLWKSFEYQNNASLTIRFCTNKLQIIRHIIERTEQLWPKMYFIWNIVLIDQT